MARTRREGRDGLADRSAPSGGFTKRRLGAPAGFFGVEAAGLRWLVVPGGAAVVEVLGVTGTSITLTALSECPPTPAAAYDFGASLAGTHDAGASAFGVGPAGWSGDGFIGDAPLSLRPMPTWGAFYAEQRVLPYAYTAFQQGTVTATELAQIEALAARLAAGDFDDGAAPARLHGDLWAGNVVFTADSATLIDPAAHGGHRLSDLAMLSLFGFPQLEQVFAGYSDASDQLPDGWRELIGLHQLHPLLVHAVLFGASFGSRAADLARRY